MSSRPSSSRWRAAFASACLAMAVSVTGSPAASGASPQRTTVADDTTRGVTRYTLSDAADAPGATCSYDKENPRRRVFIPVRLPTMLWPNLDPNVPDESGIVGWRLRLQKTHGPSGPFRTVYRSELTLGVATETARAEIPKHAINWRVPGDVSWRIQVRMVWRDAEGNTIGYAKHRVQWYRQAVALRPWSPVSAGGKQVGQRLGVSEGSCPNLLPR